MPGRTPDGEATTAMRRLRLDRNERLRAAPELADLLASVPLETVGRYPDAGDLEAALADRWRVAPDRVLVTAGADDAIDRMTRALPTSRREILSVTPTFEMYPFFARLAAARVVAIPCLDDPAPDELLGAVGPRTGAVVVVTPHNPTGRSGATARRSDVARAVPDRWLVVDLAYVEFSDEDPTPTLLERPNAVVIRTLSKAWGLAGVRIGYALGSPAAIERLRKAGPPYAVAGPSLWIAERALSMEERITRPYVEAVRRERDRLGELLRGLGAEVFPSCANFVLARLDGAAVFARSLARQGIFVRRFDGEGDLVRITLPGDPTAFARLERTVRSAWPEGLRPSGAAAPGALT